MSDLNNTLGAITLYKSADEQTFQDALREYYSRGLRATALQKALGIGATGLGVGLGARGLLGLLGLGRHNVSQEDPYASSVIDIEEEEEKQAGIMDFIKGRYAESTQGVPWAIPAAVGAGAGGLYGGWKMMDYILDQRRSSRIDEELEEAKAEYEAALADTKEAADGSFSKDLDELYNNLTTYGEKAAASWPEMGGQAAGVYGTAAGLGALLMAIMGYKHGKKKQRKRVIDKAQTIKRREEYRRRPDPLFVRANRELTIGPTTEDESSDAAPSLDEIEDQLI